MRKSRLENIATGDKNLLVFQLSVSGLNHKSFEGGVVLCPELEADQLAGLHPLPGQGEEGGAGLGLGGVVMARGQAWSHGNMLSQPQLVTGTYPGTRSPGLPWRRKTPH